MVSKRLRFAMRARGGFRAVREIESQVRPHNQTLLNRTPWRAFEARSCAVTSVQARSPVVGDPQAVIVDIEVTYRPKGYISYDGKTKYDGWSVMVLNRSRDGVLLDQQGQPLRDGDRPVEVANEVFRDVEFNELEFGELIEEVAVEPVKVALIEDVIEEITAIAPWDSLSSTFMAPHRIRPLKRIVLSSAPTEQTVDGLGSHIINIHSSTPHLEHVLMEQLFAILCEFIEGKASIHNYGSHTLTFVEFADSLISCQRNEHGFATWTNVLHWFTPREFLEDMAKRLMALFALDVAVVQGNSLGLLLRLETQNANGGSMNHLAKRKDPAAMP